MKLDPISLRLFVAVMETGTIAAAAAREHLATAAASRRISDLEGALSAVLFARSNKGTEPTAAAYALLGLARGVLNGLDGIAAQMQGYADGVRGQVRVSANISAITQFLPRELRDFMDRYPRVQVHLQERISTAVAREVAENIADIGILNAGHFGDERIALLPYREDELVVVVPKAHPLARRLVTLWVVQNIVLVASSALRTIDYIESSMLTAWRIAALAWMALVALGLVLICWRILAGRSIASAIAPAISAVTISG